MKKELLLILLLALCCDVLIAQEYDDGPIDRSYRLALGPKVGAGVSFGSHSNQQNLSFLPSLGYQFGAVFNVHMGRRFDLSEGGTGKLGFQVEALYCHRNLKLGSSVLGERCIEMPLLVQYYFVSSVAIEVGATLVHVIKCTPSQLDYQGAHYHTGAIVGNDVMITAGVCYKTPFGLVLDARYNNGFTNLAGNFDTKVSTVMLSATYIFNIVK